MALVASIPNVRYFLNLNELLRKKDWEYKKWGILDNTHLRFFTKKSLIRSIEINNYLLEEISGINPLKISFKSFKEFLVYSFAKIVLGEDIQYLRFVIRIKDKPRL